MQPSCRVNWPFVVVFLYIHEFKAQEHLGKKPYEKNIRDIRLLVKLRSLYKF